MNILKSKYQLMKPRTKNKFIKHKNPNYRKCIKSIYINKRNLTGKLNYYGRDVKIRQTTLGFKIGGIYKC